jgi:transposase
MLPGRGRKPKLTEAQGQQVIDWVKEEPKSLKKIQIKIVEEWKLTVSKDREHPNFAISINA